MESGRVKTLDEKEKKTEMTKVSEGTPCDFGNETK